MTRIINDQQAQNIRALSTIGEFHFDQARSLSEDAGFHLFNDGLELKIWLWEQVRQGNLDAQHALAEFLLVGLFGAPDHREARQLAGDAATKNHLPSRLLLAAFATPSEEFALVRDVAALGYPPAMRHLGVMYSMGSGAPRDGKLAAHCFSKAADDGDAYSQFMLARLLFETAEPSNWGQGISLLERAAKNEMPSALEFLAEIHESGLFGVEVNHRMAETFLRRANIAKEIRTIS